MRLDLKGIIFFRVSKGEILVDYNFVGGLIRLLRFFSVWNISVIWKGECLILILIFNVFVNIVMRCWIVKCE